MNSKSIILYEKCMYLADDDKARYTKTANSVMRFL